MQTQSQRQDATSKYHYRDFAPIRLKWPTGFIPWRSLEQPGASQRIAFQMARQKSHLAAAKNREKNQCRMRSDLTSEI